MRIVCTIEARMNSKRLPGKVMLRAANKPMLQHLIERLKKIKRFDQIVVATTANKEDDVIVNLAKKLKVKYFRGSEENVMQRVMQAASSVKADVVTEITADCPILDFGIVDQILNIFLNNNADYVSNNNIRSYPDGMDVQVFSIQALKKSYKLTSSKIDREHVTLHIKRNPKIFRIINVLAPSHQHLPELGLTLDEKKDYILIKKIIDHFNDKNPFFNCYDVINFLNSNKGLLKINSNVKRKITS